VVVNHCMGRRLSLVKGCDINPSNDALESSGVNQSFERVLRDIFSLTARHNLSKTHHEALQTDH
jgi:hypothetical protein